MDRRAATITRDALALITAARADNIEAADLLVQCLDQLRPGSDESMREALERQAMLLFTLASFAAEALIELSAAAPEVGEQALRGLALRVAEDLEAE